MNICLYPSDFDGPGCYRVLFPARELRVQGGHVALMPHYERTEQSEGTYLVGFDPTRVPEADLYVFQNPRERIWGKVAEELKRRGAKVVVEVDDWFAGIPRYLPAHEGLEPYLTSYKRVRGSDAIGVERKRKGVSRDHVHALLSIADAVSVSTPFLAEHYQPRARATITVLPNYLDWPMWKELTPRCEIERKRIRIGWMGNALLRGGDLSVLRGLIGPWLERNPDVDFVAAGSPETHDLIGVPKGQRVSYKGVVFSSGKLPWITNTMDVGLVPLERNPFNEAKSHLKGMEYAACGIPCIATPTASYREWVEHGVNGFLARSARDWTRHLDELVANEALRREMGFNARAKAMRNTMQEHWRKWESFYASVLVPAALAA